MALCQHKGGVGCRIGFPAGVHVDLAASLVHHKSYRMDLRARAVAVPVAVEKMVTVVLCLEEDHDLLPAWRNGGQSH